MMKKRFSKQVKRHVKKHAKKVKHVKWLLPGWAGYEYYSVYRDKGFSKRKSLVHGAKAEAIRLAATASFPVPGAYEITTMGLASLNKKIKRGEVEHLNFKSLRNASPFKKLKPKKKEIVKGYKKKH